MVWVNPLLQPLIKLLKIYQFINKSNQFDTDDENRSLRPTRPLTNSRAQEPKGFNNSFTSANNTDDEIFH